MKKELVDVFDISYEGAGVGKIDGKVVFVPKTLKGEKVEVEVVKDKKQYLIGKVSKVVERSDKRIGANCPYFDVCGGCDFQHCDYDTEKLTKEEILKEELRKVGFDGTINFVESSQRFFYRNKIKLEVENGKIGYFKSKSRELVVIDYCPIATKEINIAINIVKKFLKENNLKTLRSVYFKQSGDSVGICFLFDKNSQIVLKKLKNIELFDDFSVFFAFGEVLESNATQIICVKGKEKLVGNFCGEAIEVDISAFNQVNDEVAEKLYEYVINQLEQKRVINAYSGQGLLTYLISKSAKFVYGIEYQKSAHESAERLCKRCEEYKIENVCGRVEDCLGRILLRDNIETIVLDPAREGCKKEVLQAILDSKIKQIIYVSCNFSTLARDLKILQNSYNISSVKIFDMFPCTANMETVVIMERKADF